MTDIMTHLKGLGDILAFLAMLERKKIFYRLDHARSDAIMVSYTLLGMRVELEFFEDHIEYSYFTGSEKVLRDQEALFAMIDDFTNG